MASTAARETHAIERFLTRMFEHVKRVVRDRSDGRIVGVVCHGEHELVKFSQSMASHGTLDVWVTSLEGRIASAISSGVKLCLQRRPEVVNLAKKWRRKSDASLDVQPEPEAPPAPAAAPSPGPLMKAGSRKKTFSGHDLLSMFTKRSSLMMEEDRRKAKAKEEDGDDLDEDVWLIDGYADVPIQSALVANSVDWAEKMDYILTSSNKSPYRLDNFLDALLDRMNTVVAAHVVAKTSQRKLSALCALLSTQLLHLRDVTQKLKKNNVHEQSRAEYQMLPRSYLQYDATTHTEVQVKISKWTSPYGFEYQGAYSRLGLTTGGDQALFKLAYAMRCHMGSTVHIENPSTNIDVSKNLYLSRLAAVLGRPFVTLSSTPDTTIVDVFTLMKKSIKRGAVGLVESIDKLTPATVSEMGTVLSAVRNAWFNKNQKWVELSVGALEETLHLRPLADNEIAITNIHSPRVRALMVESRDQKDTITYLPFGFSFFTTIAPSSSEHTIPLKLQAVMRNVTVALPSLEVLVKSLLLSAGFVSTDRITALLQRTVSAIQSEFSGSIKTVQYTTIAGGIMAAAQYLEKLRSSEAEIGMEMENTIDVWSEHNDAEEAKALRVCLGRSIYQQIVNQPRSHVT
jgi:hypothetical protein